MYEFQTQRSVVENFLSNNGKNAEWLKKELETRSLTSILNDRAAAGDVEALTIISNYERKGIDIEKRFAWL